MEATLQHAVQSQSPGATPTVVAAAFAAPEGSLTLRLIDILRLERLGSPLLLGKQPKLSDLIIAYGAITDWPALSAAHQAGTLDAWIEAFAAARPASEITRIASEITAAVQSAFAPAPHGQTQGDSTEKKTSPVAGGGSPSPQPSATTTAGHPA